MNFLLVFHHRIFLEVLLTHAEVVAILATVVFAHVLATILDVEPPHCPWRVLVALLLILLDYLMEASDVLV